MAHVVADVSSIFTRSTLGAFWGLIFVYALLSLYGSDVDPTELRKGDPHNSEMNAMAAQPDTQAAKSGAANHKAGDQNANSGRGRGDHVPQNTGGPPVSAPEFWRQMMATQEHAIEFGIRRAQRYQRFFHDMGACGAPTDAMRIYAEAFRCCIEDYMDEAKRLSEGSEAWSSFAAAFTPSTKALK